MDHIIVALQIFFQNQLSTNVAWCFRNATSIFLAMDQHVTSKAVSLDFFATDIAFNTRIFVDIVNVAF